LSESDLHLRDKYGISPEVGRKVGELVTQIGDRLFPKRLETVVTSEIRQTFQDLVSENPGAATYTKDVLGGFLEPLHDPSSVNELVEQIMNELQQQ
jgi:hypothetical protein